MSAMAHDLRTTGGILLPALLLTALLAFVAAEAGWAPSRSAGGIERPQTTTIAPRTYSYRAPGEFYRGAVQVDGPMVARVEPVQLEVMTYQVTATDYQRCVDDEACRAADPKRRAPGNVPVTGVSFDDATAYATWLSDMTGETWRLPTVAEWVFAAAERAVDPALGFDGDAANPAERWLALYEREIDLGVRALAAPEPVGSFGFNTLGVADMAGTVWEWTSTCASRTTLAADGSTLTALPSCGVRYLEGRHRTQMSTFIRDARSGGCSTGTPPDNLGFRLVRETGFWQRIGAMLTRPPGG